MPDMDMRMASGEGEELGGGREELDLETDPPTIKAEGALFPILVHELYKGVMDYVSSHGLPSDPSTAEDVYRYGRYFTSRSVGFKIRSCYLGKI